MMGMIVGFLMWCTSCCVIPVNDTFPSKSHLVLPEIQIKGNALVAKRRGDTLVFAADRFKRADALRLEQLLNNVPGFQVDPNGNISFNGRPIKKLMIDGDDLTAENYQLISRNLRSLMVDSIQVLENYHENRLLKNVQGNNDLAVNLVLKKTFYGRPNVNLTAAFAPQQNGEFQGELIQFKRRSKRMVIFNANNVGSRSLQNNSIEQQASVNKQRPLFRSWPGIFNNILPSTLENKYVNTNSDRGVDIANSININKHTHLRINLKTAYHFTSTAFTQYQLFSSLAVTPVLLFSTQRQQRMVNANNILLYWEADKGEKHRTTYELESYYEKNTVYTNEDRKLNVSNHLKSSAYLIAKGFRFNIDHSWKTSKNQIWQWETSLNGSANNYQILIERNDIILVDTFDDKGRHFIHHKGLNAQTGIGHIRTSQKNIVRYWLRTSLTKLYSSQYQNDLQLMGLKNYLSTHLTRSFTKKIHFDLQSMLGFVQMNFNKNAYKNLIYHVDQAVVWKPKATRQLSLNYGILRQETDANRYFAGAVYSNATTQIIGPSIVTFPVTFYSQMHFSLLDLYHGLNLFVQLMIKEVKRDYFMATTLHPLYTTIHQKIAERQSSASINFHLEKIIHHARLKYRLLYSGMQLNGPAQFNNQKFIAVNSFARVGQHISTNWRKGYNFQVEYQFIQSQFSGTSNAWLKNIRHEYKAIFELQLNRQLNTHFVFQRYSGKDIVKFELLDFKINWSSKGKFRFFIDGNNLLNKKLFVQQTLSTNAISSNQQYLIGRRVIIGADIPL